MILMIIGVGSFLAIAAFSLPLALGSFAFIDGAIAIAVGALAALGLVALI
jgi:hypothetical protein